MPQVQIQVMRQFNFKDVTFKSKFGTSNQTAMSGIPAESRTPVGVQVEVENDDLASTWTAIDDGAGNLSGKKLYS